MKTEVSTKTRLRTKPITQTKALDLIKRSINGYIEDRECSGDLIPYCVHSIQDNGVSTFTVISQSNEIDMIPPKKREKLELRLAKMVQDEIDLYYKP